jgi:hypothetical protein
MDDIQQSQPVDDDSDVSVEGHAHATDLGAPVATTEAEALTTEAEALTTEAEALTTETADVSGAGPAAPPEPDLIVELAAAMHAAAARERERIETAIAERLGDRVEVLQSRAREESDELRRLADDDVERIDEWAAAEIDRIRQRALRRSDERRAALDDYLAQYASYVEAEITRVAKATAIYREGLDAFFAELDTTTDPAEIARLAGSLPAMPDLEDLPAEPTVPVAEPNATTEATTRAELDAASEAGAEIEDDPTETVSESSAADTQPDAEKPLVGVMTPVAPAPVPPVTAIVSGPPVSGVSATAGGPAETQAVASSEEPRHRGPMGILRTIAPWSRHDQDASPADADQEGNGP